ncbi:MAG: DUF3352 domain-containing protein [Candidatus Omnitrophota bacterium]|nr:DUF3352 domain-containing protein [Candidatus Omnitrophota bacterium]
MKKIVIIFLAAILFLGIGIYYYKAKIAKLEIESIIPANPVLYLHVRDIEKRLDKFKTTKLWRNINNIDVEYLMKKSGVAEDKIEQYRKFNSEFSKFASGLLLEKFFGQEIAVAVYPIAGNITGFNSEAMRDIASNIILVTRVKPEAEFIDFIRKIYGKFDKQTVTKYEKYQKHEITIIEIKDNFNIAYVKIKDLLVIGLGKRGVSDCLDVLNRLKTPISQDKDFISTIEQLPKPAETLAYVNLKALLPGMKNLAVSSLKSDNKNLQSSASALRNFSKLEGFKTLGFASVAGKIPKSKFIFTFDKNKLDPLLIKTYSVKPQLNNTINFVPKGIIGYQWACFDPKGYWESLKKEMPGQYPGSPAMPSPAQVIDGIQNTLGVDIEGGIIPALGNEAGGLLSDINLSGPFPIPELVFFIKVNNKGAIEAVLNSLIAKGNLQTRSENYQNKNISYILLPFGASLQPAYCFLDNYLLISTSNKLLQDCIDASKDKAKSLLANTDFQAINLGLTDKGNSLFFLKPDLLFDKMKKIGEWFIGWASIMSANADAYQKQMQENLNLAEKQIQDEESKLKNLKDKQQMLKEEIDNIKGQDLRVTDKESELSKTEAQIRAKQDNVDFARKELEKREEEFKKTNEYLAKRRIDPSLVKLYLDEAAYPILEGLESFKAFGSITIFKENAIETLSYSITLED